MARMIYLFSIALLLFTLGALHTTTTIHAHPQNYGGGAFRGGAAAGQPLIINRAARSLSSNEMHLDDDAELMPDAEQQQHRIRRAAPGSAGQQGAGKSGAAGGTLNLQNLSANITTKVSR